MWKSIVGVWLKVRPGLTKTNPTNAMETLRQPLFKNSSILNSNGAPLGVSGLNEGSASARHRRSRIKDLWNPVDKEWKRLPELGMSNQASNKRCLDIITASIPWRLDECISHPQKGDWISNSTSNTGTPLD
jgi:hypothetical protein